MTGKPATSIDQLVDQFVAAGEWPEPALCETILEHGSEAIGPLRAVVRGPLETSRHFASARLAAQILATLRADQAIPEIVALLRRTDLHTHDPLAESFKAFGAQTLEPLLEAVGDPALHGTRLAAFAMLARHAAGDDPNGKFRVASVLRDRLNAALARTEPVNPDLVRDVTNVVAGLAGLADPFARTQIEAAFSARLVDEQTIDRQDVDRLYESGGAWKSSERRNWIDSYRQRYEHHMQHAQPGQTQTASPRKVQKPAPPLIRDPGPQPLRKRNYRPARNGICWCGSGKKYKKCHLAFDGG